MTDSMSKPSKMKVNMSRNGDGEAPRMVKLGELLTLDAEPERIDNPADETFVTVRTKCGGAVERVIKDGKIPVAFTGYRIHEGQLIYSRIDARNNAFAIVPSELDGAVVSKDFPVFRVDERKVLKSYLMHFFRSGRLQYAIQQYSKGITNRQRIKEEVLLSFSIPLPSLEEQRRIVAVLDRADAIRTKRRRVLADLDELPRSLFAEMFGDPVSNSKGWKYALLSELGSVERGVSKFRPRNAPELLGGPYPLIQTGDVTRAQLYIRDYMSTYSELGLSQSRMWHRGTLCITIAANIAQTAILDFDACFPDSVVGFVANESTNNLFIHFWFTFFQKILERQAPESAQKNINLKILGQLKVILPPIELQKEFARRVEAIAAARVKVERALALDDELFAALQSRAFRGAL
ncbi:restriction endonuclease subunit S [Bifidobacterium callitrichos]|uniref:Restriction endonuclease subunit S n=1 Tax=Bifidobacterium callitrichos TaxID=762209 RepID=A0A5M9ZBU7_9BIFI|nr:restriction endonuclease subunit S [Bifidobacterium callitrichos]KAA8816232.1 restriction endonuclease subunit S [Bifidobacterium callitrichos]